MAIRIGSNISSIAAQRQLADSSSRLASTFERLASGSRINKASDDAAGLAIAERLNAKSRVLSRGIKNVNDGISLVAIADSALSALSGVTTRIVELAEQSANGTYSNQQRKAMDQEAQALSMEYFRISRSTTFNGIGLFDGGLQALSIQAGEGTDGLLSSSMGGKMGTGSFGSQATLFTGSGPQKAVLGDLTNDGILDLVTASYWGGTEDIVFLQGKGDGTFINPVELISHFSMTNSLALADLNGDGLLDIAAGFSGTPDGSVSVFLNQGNGTFGAKTEFALGQGVTSVAVSDLNGDGKADIVSSNSSDSTVSVLLGKGDGTFQSRVNYAVGTSPKSVVVGDLNGDGIPDLVTANSGSANASILLGRGDGTFAAQTTVAAGGNLSDVTLGDLNGDGILDMVTARSGSANVSVFTGRGDGTFSAALNLTTAVSPTSVALGDLNGDGTTDIITGGSNSSSILLGKGGGSFSSHASMAVGGNVTSIALGDVNGDGVLDLTTGTSGVSVFGFLGSTRDGVSPILPFSLKTKADALQALVPLKRKLDSLASQRGVLGAFEARLGTAAAALMSSVENYNAAESRIRDADVAADAAQMARLGILRDAAAAMLGQANQQPQIALQLLKYA